MITNPKDLARRLKKAKKSARLSIDQLARSANLPNTTVQKILAGNQEPGCFKIAALALAMGCSTDYLLGLEGEELTVPEATPDETDVLVEWFSGLSPKRQRIVAAVAFALDFPDRALEALSRYADETPDGTSRDTSPAGSGMRRGNGQ